VNHRIDRIAGDEDPERTHQTSLAKKRSMTRIADLVVRRLDVPLKEPFGIASGAQEVAENLLVELRTDDGTLGIGEAAPFPAFNSETRAGAEAALEGARSALIGLEVERWRAASDVARHALAQAPSALCAFETALLDAFTRQLGCSLFSFFGGKEPVLETDITLTTGSAEQAKEQAARAKASGFSVLKLKVGGAPLAHDLERLCRAADAAPEARFVLDANASLSAPDAVRMFRALGSLSERVVLFEQPTAKDDVAGLAKVRSSGARVAADESVCSLPDLERVVSERAADVINVKIMKSGLVGALDLALGARAAGLGLMIGGLVETRLAMTASACLAGGLGGFSHVDLDTPLFLAEDPFEGGYVGRGPSLALAGIGPGHGVRVRRA
jgi:L-alanine-DL-glutamate epimerase-like enolase superfamily enzyme